MRSIDDVQCIEARHAPGAQADLFGYQAAAPVPFAIRRVFTVHAREAVRRGHHAHKACSQMMVCLAGRCTVMLDDGKTRRSVELSRPQDALHVPPSIWAEQSYEEPGTILMVMCDQDYDEGDYIRDYDVFLAYRKGAA